MSLRQSSATFAAQTRGKPAPRTIKRSPRRLLLLLLRPLRLPWRGRHALDEEEAQSARESACASARVRDYVRACASMPGCLQERDARLSGL